MTTFINLRTFSHHEDKTEHSYYVGHEIRCLSEPSDSVAVDQSTTFYKLREVVEEQRSGNIMQRRPSYAEFLQFMQRCPNPFSYEGKDLSSYRFGYVKTTDKGTAPPTVEDI